MPYDLHDKRENYLIQSREEADLIKKNKVAAYALAKRDALDVAEDLGIVEILNMKEHHLVKLAQEVKL